jgi:aminoglycoside phosphotransferase (APT) family kinase protein
MRLSLEHVHLYLLDKGYLTPAALVSGDYQASQMVTRNAIFQITCRHSKSLFIKQTSNFDPASSYVLQKDATCLWLIKNHPEFARLSAYVPAYFGFDPENQILVTEFLADASDLEHYARQHEGQVSEAMQEELAAVLASYHFPLSPALLAHRSVQFFPRQLPWVLSIMDNAPATQQLMSHPSAPAVLAALAGKPDFKAALAAIAREWTPTSLIHGDIKWLNLLTQTIEGRDNIRIIDWEFADIGDPLWDVAGVLHDFITSAIFYNPVLASNANLVTGIGLDELQDIWPLLERFWVRYQAQRTLSPQDLAKTLRYTAARLVQSAIERNMLLSTLQPNSIKLLQASYAMLTQLPQLLLRFSNPTLAAHA